MSMNQESTTVHDKIEENISIFIEAVELSPDLEIVDTTISKQTEIEVFIIRNHALDEGIEGAFVEISVNEVIEKVEDFDKAAEIIKVLTTQRAAIVVNGVTRIVGYYSRVNNWNKSKIGELRDRVASRMTGGYILGKDKPLFQNEAETAVNNLTCW